VNVILVKRLKPGRTLAVSILVGLVVMASAAPAFGEPASALSEVVIAHYQDAVQQQQQTMKNVAMDVTMEASIPKLKKQGKLSALRVITNVGRITYKVLGFSGDDTVKKEVIARYMTAEVDSTQSRSSELGITPKNYSFKYKGSIERNGQKSFIFELKPREKRVGLFKGELWIDSKTYLPIREQGRFVKSPSVFIKNVDFVRNYEIRDGVAYLTHMESKTDTRIVGLARLNIDYANYHPQPPDETDEDAVEAAQSR